MENEFFKFRKRIYSQVVVNYEQQYNTARALFEHDIS